MADIIKKATRESYGEALKELAEEFDNLVVLDADLAAATKTGIFKKAYPDRFFDCGIAEANMMGVAAGLATTGKIPFASTFAMFAAGRAYEIVRNSIGYPHLNVKIGATHAGISVGEDGATHQCNEDIALMRTIPGMTIINPADDVEAKQAVKAAAKLDGPVYLRFGRLAVPIFNDEKTYKFELGKGITLHEADADLSDFRLAVYRTDHVLHRQPDLLNDQRLDHELPESPRHGQCRPAQPDSGRHDVHRHGRSLQQGRIRLCIRCLRKRSAFNSRSRLDGCSHGRRHGASVRNCACNSALP